MENYTAEQLARYKAEIKRLKRNARQKRYRDKHREQIRAYNARYRAEHREQIKKYNIEYWRRKDAAAAQAATPESGAEK